MDVRGFVLLLITNIEAQSWPLSRVHIAGISIDVDGRRPVSKAMEVLQPARIELSRYLLDYERSHGGLAFGFSGANPLLR